MKTLTHVKTQHPGGYPDIIQALRDTGDPKRIQLAGQLESLQGLTTGILATQASDLLRRAGLPTYENEKLWKQHADTWFEEKRK